MIGPVPLALLGWTDAREHEFEPHRSAGCVPGRVSLEHNHVFRVLTGEGEQLAESAGRLKHHATARRDLPVVGDWVALRPDAGQRWQIRHVMSRRTALSRKAAGRETEEQVLAANIDVVFVVFGLDTHVKPRAIERYLTVVRRSGAEAVVILSKADLVDSADGLDEDIALARAAAGSAPVVPISVRTGLGREELLAFLQSGRTIAVVGPSGAGKSTLVNQIVERDVLPTGDVRDWDARGRHTSVHRQLLVRDGGGIVIDTPGMRELQLWDTDAVADGFTDIDDIAADCRFRDCRHRTEPGCAVKAAVDEGRLEADRFESFTKLLHEQEAIEKKRAERALTDAKRASKQQGRALRTLYRDRDRRGHR